MSVAQNIVELRLLNEVVVSASRNNTCAASVNRSPKFPGASAVNSMLGAERQDETSTVEYGVSKIKPELSFFARVLSSQNLLLLFDDVDCDDEDADDEPLPWNDFTEVLKIECETDLLVTHDVIHSFVCFGPTCRRSSS